MRRCKGGDGTWGIKGDSLLVVWEGGGLWAPVYVADPLLPPAPVQLHLCCRIPSACPLLALPLRLPLPPPVPRLTVQQPHPPPSPEALEAGRGGIKRWGGGPLAPAPQHPCPPTRPAQQFSSLVPGPALKRWRQGMVASSDRVEALSRPPLSSLLPTPLRPQCVLPNSSAALFPAQP